MDSLDELLADLHSATSTMKSEQQAAQSSSTRSSSSSGSLPSQVYQARFSPNRSNGSEQFTGLSPRNLYNNDNKSMSQQRYNGSGDRLNSGDVSKRDSDRYSASSAGSGDIPAPPLPPPPSRDVIEEAITGFSSEPLYEPQNVVHMPRGSPYNSNPQGSQLRTQYVPSDVGTSQTALGANLTELDYLLQDLNSEQFMQEISRSASDNSVGSLQSSNPNTRLPPPTLPKPTQKSPLRSPNVTVTFDVADGKPTSDGSQASGDLSATGYASSATKELEELMDSLSQFKVTENAQSLLQDGEPAYAKVDKPSSKPATPDDSQSKPSELDNMLGNLESDMRGHGVSVSTKGLCGACAKPIVGQVITALGRIWHPEHFCCHNCKEELGTRSFFERAEMPYCEQCYHRLFAPLCAQCNTPILDKCVTAMDTTWHMECFTCEHCGRMLNDEGFHERNGRPYCRNDYFEIFAPKCGGCSLPIIEDFISTLNTHWHTQCFKCMECGVTLAGGSFYDHDGQPYCETHYYAKRGSLCAGCQKPITGRCITAMSRKFHPEHFTCAFCLKQLNKGTFKEQNDKPYCHPCFIKLFG